MKITAAYKRDLVKIGKAIKKIREEKNLTQEFLAREITMTLATYARLEKGEARFTISACEKICKTLNIKSTDILPF